MRIAWPALSPDSGAVPLGRGRSAAGAAFTLRRARRRLLLADVERLLPEEEPGGTKPEVRANQLRALRQARLRRIGQEPRDHRRRAETGELRSLRQALVREGDTVVDEVPVAAAGQAHVRLQHDD